MLTKEQAEVLAARQMAELKAHNVLAASFVLKDFGPDYGWAVELVYEVDPDAEYFSPVLGIEIAEDEGAA
jgi:hypothetical protein